MWGVLVSLLEFRPSLWLVFFILLFIYVVYSFVAQSFSFNLSWNEAEEAREARPKSLYDISIFLGTWNMEGTVPPTSLVDWLMPGGKKFDLYAIGVQECSYKCHPEDANCDEKCTERHWFDLIQNQLNREGSQYVRLVGASRDHQHRMVVFINSKLASRVHDVECCVKNVCSQRLNRSGVIAVSMKIHSTSLCFLNCHFLPQGYEEGNPFNIFQRIKLGFKGLSVLQQFQHTFLFGNLNTPLNVTDEQLSQLTSQKKWKDIYETDTLFHMQDLTLLADFNEDIPNSAPRKIGNDYSYSDRILWRSMPNSQLNRENTPQSISLRDGARKTATSASFSMEIMTAPQDLTPTSAYRIELVISEICVLGVKSYPNRPNIFISFYAPFIEQSLLSQTSVKSIQDPYWSADQIPLLKGIIANEAYLQYLIMGVFIEDPGSPGSPTLLGQAVVSARPLVDVRTKDSPALFSSKLYRDGKQIQNLEIVGYFHIHWRDKIVWEDLPPCECNSRKWKCALKPQAST